MGLELIHADRIKTFCRDHLNPYMNLHRPCGVPELETDEKGKTKRVYEWYAAPSEIRPNAGRQTETLCRVSAKENRMTEGLRKYLAIDGAENETHVSLPATYHSPKNEGRLIATLRAQPFRLISGLENARGKTFSALSLVANFASEWRSAFPQEYGQIFAAYTRKKVD